MFNALSYLSLERKRFDDGTPWENSLRYDGNEYDYINDFYSNISNADLRCIFTIIHLDLNFLFKYLNGQINEHVNIFDVNSDDIIGYVHASQSRSLIAIINKIKEIHFKLKSTTFRFDIEKNYYSFFNQCLSFLKDRNGSQIPARVRKVNIIEDGPIFTLCDTITQEAHKKDFFSLKLIGEGSYARVFKYKDDNYGKFFAVKRALDNLNEKELKRFEQEFLSLQSLKSPYIVEVYKYNDEKKEYTMEYMDNTLYSFIQENNSTIPAHQRINISRQILRGFKYIHSKNLLHRDISPKNILIKSYEDVQVIKISDFGLVKIPGSTLTSKSTEFKGYFNDDNLKHEGFDSYSLHHETYAITRLLYFVLTGKTQTNKIGNPQMKAFVEKGINPDVKIRFKDADELEAALMNIEV